MTGDDPIMRLFEQAMLTRKLSPVTISARLRLLRELLRNVFVS